VKVRCAHSGDFEEIVPLRARLWPDTSVEEHQDEARAILSGKPRSTLPLVLLIAEDEGALIGFVEVGLRSHADGCDPRQPVGFIEGWYVVPGDRRHGVGRALIDSAETWAREQGCIELASDTWSDNHDAQHAHAALGFEVVDRCVNFRKAIGAGSGASASTPRVWRDPSPPIVRSSS